VAEARTELDELIGCCAFLNAWEIALSDEPAGGLNDAVEDAAESRARMSTRGVRSVAPGRKP